MKRGYLAALPQLVLKGIVIETSVRPDGMNVIRIPEIVIRNMLT